VDLLALAAIASGIAWVVIRRHRHPEMPPTEEAVEEACKEHAHDKLMPNSGWNGVWH
jgi:hypothetical protein